YDRRAPYSCNGGQAGAIQAARGGITSRAHPRFRRSSRRAIGSPLVAWVKASSWRLLGGASLTRRRGFRQRARRPVKKNCARRGGFQAAFPHYPMNRHNTKKRRKNQNKSKQKNRKKNPCKLNNH